MNTAFRLFPEAASQHATRVDALFWFTVGVTVFFSGLIFITIFVFATKYRRRSETEIPRPIEGSLKLEITWTVIPLLISLGIFAWASDLYFDNYSPPQDAQEIYVVGKQWMWKLQHPEGRREINELHVAVNTPVKFTLASEDVIHSFFIPSMRIKQDAVPGRYQNIWIRPTRVGTYHLFCAEYCGTGHSAMIGTVYVMDPVEYEAWLTGGGPGVESMATSGQHLFEQYGCVTCHLTNGTGRGPSLVNVFGHQQQTQQGIVMADEGYIRESILNPSAKIVQGYQNIMPTFQGQISEDGILQLIAYLRSLSTVTPTGQSGSTAPPGAIPRPQGNPASQPGSAGGNRTPQRSPQR